MALASRINFAEKYLFDEHESWNSCNRGVTVGKSKNITIVATMPCANCATKRHIDLRLRCVCASTRDVQCIQCVKDNQACVAIPPVLLGAAQRISMFAAIANGEIVKIVRAAAKSVPLSLTKVNDDQVVRAGRAMYLLTEAELSLRRALEQEFNGSSSPDSTRLDNLNDEKTASLRRLITLGLQTSAGYLRGEHVDKAAFARLVSYCAPPQEEANAIIGALDRAITDLDQDLDMDLRHGEQDWVKRFTESPCKFLTIAKTYSSDGDYGKYLEKPSNAPPFMLTPEPRHPRNAVSTQLIRAPGRVDSEGEPIVPVPTFPALRPSHRPLGTATAPVTSRVPVAVKAPIVSQADSGNRPSGQDSSLIDRTSAVPLSAIQGSLPDEKALASESVPTPAGAEPLSSYRFSKACAILQASSASRSAMGHPAANVLVETPSNPSASALSAAEIPSPGPPPFKRQKLTSESVATLITPSTSATSRSETVNTGCQSNNRKRTGCHDRDDQPPSSS